MRLVKLRTAGREAAPGAQDVWVDADSVRVVTRYVRYYNGTRTFAEPAQAEVERGLSVILIDLSTTVGASTGLKLTVEGEPEEVIKKLSGSIADQLLNERMELQRRLVQVDAAMEEQGR